MGLSESFRCLSVIAQYGGTGPDVGHGQRASELHVRISTDGDRTQFSGCGAYVLGYKRGEHRGSGNEGLAEKDQAPPFRQPIGYFSSDTGRPASQSER
jgi:hypothetical protein